MRESDLLAFEIGIEGGRPAAVMCSYNAVNGDFACENKYLLTDVLKKDWDFKGFVVSDWGGTHSTVKASPPDWTTRSRKTVLWRQAEEGGRRAARFPWRRSTITRAACCAPSSPAD